MWGSQNDFLKKKRKKKKICLINCMLVKTVMYFKTSISIVFIYIRPIFAQSTMGLWGQGGSSLKSLGTSAIDDFTIRYQVFKKAKLLVKQSP